MHESVYKQLELNLRYVKIEVSAGKVGKCLESLIEKGYQGANVTIPHKLEALDWAKPNVSDAGLRIGAINTIRFSDRSAINTDAPAIVETLQNHGVQPGSKILVLGAGGSARAAWYALTAAGYSTFAYNRTAQRLQEALTDFGSSISIVEQLKSGTYDAILNATASSLTDLSLDIHWQGMEGLKFAFDFAYQENPTVFVQEAIAAGIPAIDGRELLVRQGALAFEFWLGFKPPYETMLQALN